MAWKAEILGSAVNSNNANIDVTLIFTDGSGAQQQRTLSANDLTPDRIAAYCQMVIEALEVRDSAIENLGKGEVTLPRDRQLTPEEQKLAAQDVFNLKMFALNSLLKLAESKVLAADDTSITDAKAEAETAYAALKALS